MIVFNNANFLEINEGEGEITIEIDPVASNITEVTEVEISTIDGNARSTDFINNGIGVDFTALNDLTLELDPASPDTFTFAIELTDDAIAEPDESFQFRVRATEDTTLNGTGTITIIDDDNSAEALEPELELPADPELIVEDLLPTIAIDDVSGVEGNSGVTNFEFTVSLSEASEEIVTIDYATADGTAETTPIFANSELADAADYTADSGTITFTPGETEQTISIEVLTDTESLAAESESETFFVNLFNQNNASIDDFRGISTIIDDDIAETEADNALPLIRLENTSFIEDDTENTRQLEIELVDRNGEAVIATEDISFSFSTADLSAAANLDYEFIAEQTGIIEAGESSTAIDLTIIGDEEIESEESFAVILTDLDLELAQFDDGQTELEAVVTIRDDDGVVVSEEMEAESEVAETVDDTDSEEADSKEEENELDEGDRSESEEDNDNETEEIEETGIEDSSEEDSNSGGAVSNEANDSGDVDSDLTNNTVFRFLNTDTGGYLYTASAAERESVENSQSDFEFESASFAGVDRDTESAADVYRFFNTSTEGYFYTASVTERDFVRENLDEFVFEDVAFSAFTTEVAESIPIYRFFDDSTGVHFYTGDDTERAFVEDNLSNYDAEGIAFYALPVAEMM
ncbi:MAG: Calx-beta domain-containing protein [Cyanobacteria bacterium J06623_7]